MVAASLFFLLCCMVSAFAQKSPAPDSAPTVAAADADVKAAQPVELNGDSIEYKADEAKFIASGNVFLRQNNAMLFCDRLEFFRDRKEAHAFGNVILESDKGTLWADQGFYNFETKHGDFTNARIMEYPMFGKAASITKVGENYYVLSDGWLSTSDYDEPEYRIKSRKIDYYPGNKAVARKSTMYLGTLPVMYLPWYTQDLRENRPHFSVIPGYKKDFGAFVLMAYRIRPFSHVETTYHLDYRERKDVAWGVDVKYEPSFIGQGLVRTYYMNERNVSARHIWRERDQPTIERERFRVEWRHFWKIDPQTNFIAQYYKLSDPDFLKKYFEKESRDDQNPATYAVLTRGFSRATFTLRADIRVNRYESIVERLPEANLTFSNQPIADTGFYYKSANVASKLTRQAAVPSDEQHHTVRLDTSNELSRPFKVAFLEFRPYIGAEQTYYSRTLYRQDHDTLRTIFRTGTDVSTKFYRVFDAQYNKYGVEINKLRHIITPTVSYLFQEYPTLMSDKLYGFDGVDSMTKVDQFSLGLANALQTRRGGGSADLFRSLLTTTYKLHDDPSNGDRFDNWVIRNELYPNDYITFHQDAEYNTADRHWQTANLDLYLRDKKKWDFSIGRRWTYQEDDILATSLSYTFHSKWRTVIYDRCNIVTGVLQEQQYTLVRDLHSWELEITYNDKKGYQDSGNTVWIIFRLKAFPTVTIDGGSNFNKRKLGGTYE